VQFNLYFTRELKIPPEKEREELERVIRKLLTHEQRSARLKLIIQNLSSKFVLYNNFWKKRMNEIEIGAVSFQKGPGGKFPPNGMLPEQGKTAPGPKVVEVNLNNEDTFEAFADEYKKMMPKNASQQDKIINNLKVKMISENIVNAKINLSIQNGKVKIKLKRSI
jgi:hypothetical protein